MLRNRLVDIEIPEQAPFAYDKLGRKECASNFITIAQMYAISGCVLSLNGEWGSGKTTFIKMVMQEMKNRGFHPLYFNAWENDYVADPLIALLSEIKEIAPLSKKWDSVMNNGGKIIASMASSLFKSLLKNKLGIDSDILSAGIDEATKLMKADIDDFANQKKTFQDFKKSLTNYITDNTDTDKPVVFFVDELDRCNPCFAVKVLERIKHLFDIPNVIFVLSISKRQLESAIQGYYGSNNINAANYLRRFIDVEFTLPIPNIENFCQYLYEYYDFSKVFRNNQRLQYNEFQYDEDNFNKMAYILVKNSDVDLRTIDKIFAHTRLALFAFSNNTYIIPDVFFMMCYFKVVDPTFFSAIENHEFKAQQFLYELEKHLPITILSKGDDYDYTARAMTYSIVTLIHMYDINARGIESEKIFTPQDVDVQKLTCKIIDEKLFSEAYKWECGRRGLREIPLDHIIKKVKFQDTFVNTNI